MSFCVNCGIRIKPGLGFMGGGGMDFKDGTYCSTCGRIKQDKALRKIEK